MKELKITIAGQVGTGKSTVAYLIKTMLRGYGFNVTFDPKPDFTSEVHFDTEMNRNRENRIQSVGENVKILLEEKQIRRQQIEK